MFSSDQYQLIDFGEGRKLERFGQYVLDRPAPAAEGITRADGEIWKSASARFERTDAQSGRWLPSAALPDSWNISHATGSFQLKPTEFGHVGLFPEQAVNWQWIEKQVRRQKSVPTVLNLFAYTGGSTFAAASAGARVVHVDGARNVVAWARRNADFSSLSSAPIRWIVEDALKFARREVRRGNQYDAVILDPPSYGHGPKGEVWKLHEHLMPLLEACAQLTARRRAFVLLTCHGTGFRPADAEAALADAMFGHCQSGAQARRLTVRAADDRELPAGVVARWPS